jgi:hypothetical protein
VSAHPLDPLSAAEQESLVKAARVDIDFLVAE